MARLYKFFGILSIALWFLSPAPAAANNPLYTIEGVKVDVTAENAAQAREEAFVKAEQEAFTALARRLLPEAEAATFTPPENGIISVMVRDFEITEERLSPVRYMATYTFRFKEQDVQNFFNRSGKTYTDIGSRPVLILPFYEWGSRAILWEQDNPWMAAWGRIKSYAGLVPVTVPIGDAQDIADIGDNQALTYNPDRLDRMLLRYNAGDAIIAIARPVWGANLQNTGINAMPHAVSVMIYRSSDLGPQFITNINVTAENSESRESLYDRAVAETRTILQSDWKNRTAAAPQSHNKLQARVRIASMAQWVETQKALQKVQGVHDIKLLKLSPQEAMIELTFRGGENRLRLALQQAGMILSQPQVNFPAANNTAPVNHYYNQGYYRGRTQGLVPANSNPPLVYDLYLDKYGTQP